MNPLLLSVESVDVAIMFKNDLSSKFENENLYFMVTRRGDRFGVEIMNKDISSELYNGVYRYAQIIYRNFYE